MGGIMKKISNIGTLDVRKVSEKLAKNISEFVNIGTYITSEDAEVLLKDVSKKNIGSVFKCEEDIDMINVNGDYRVDYDLLDGIHGKVMVNVNGHLIIEKDIEVDFLREKILAGGVNGIITAPKKVLGAVQTIFNVNGPVRSYDEDVAYLTNKYILNTESLLSHFGPKNVAVATLIVTEDYDRNQLENTFEKIQVLKELVIVDRLLNDLKPFLKVDGKVKILKSPVHYLRGDHELTQEMLEDAKDATIHVTGKLTCLDETVVNKLNTNLVASVIVTSRALLDLVKAKCKSSQKIRTIEDLPKENFASMKITKSVLEGLKDKSFINYGTLIFDEDLQVEDFENLSIVIKNFGSLSIPSHLENTVIALISENYGSLAEEENGAMYSNLGSLVL